MRVEANPHSSDLVAYPLHRHGAAGPRPAVARGRLIGLPEAFAIDCYRREFPAGVRWSGFLLDTLIFGAIWAIAVAAHLRLRGIARESRGRCAACGDLMHGVVVCPECGRSSGSARRATGAAGA